MGQNDQLTIKDLIWTTFKAIFSIFRFFCTLQCRFSNSCISAKYCPILTNHTSMESLFIDVWISISKKLPYDWFCGPGSQICKVFCFTMKTENIFPSPTSLCLMVTLGTQIHFFFKIILEQNELIYWSFFQICNAIWLTWDAWIFIRQYCFLLMQNYFKWSQIIWEIVGSTLIRKKLMQQYYGSEARNITVHWYMWPWTTKPVISSTGIFVAIAKNTLYGSNL